MPHGAAVEQLVAKQGETAESRHRFALALGARREHRTRMARRARERVPLHVLHLQAVSA